MNEFRELLSAANLVYVLPVAFAGMLAILRRVGLEVDVAAAVDALFGDERERESSRTYAVWRFFFPTQGLVALRVGLFVFGWAATGLTLNRVIGTQIPFGTQALVFIGACVLGFWVAVLGTRLFHFLLPTERGTTRMEDLVGMLAVVVSDRVDAEHGRARVVDTRGNTITVFCRLASGDPPPLSGSRVTLVAYDASERTFDVMTTMR